jgi:predicted nucleotidyltransferase component of viral defense system
MIDKDELVRIARKEELPLGTIEKDFVLTYILKKIYESSLKDKLIFKGGTALHRLYLHKRMSIDLDFTEISPVKSNEIKKIIEDKNINSKIREIVRTDKSTKIVLSYISVLEYKNNIVLDISKREKPILKLIKKKAKSPYFKEIEILTFQLEELIAEKIRAIEQRKRPRDYLDIFYILNKKSFDFEKSLKIAKQKLKLDKDSFDIERIFSDLDIVRNLWERDLTTILPDIPDFDKVIRKLKKKFGYFK